MAKMTYRGTLDVFQTIEQIKTLFPKTSRSTRLVDETIRSVDYEIVVLLVFEKYFYRLRSYITLTIMVTAFNKVSEVVVIASGAGRETFFRNTWGSEVEFINTFTKVIESCGFIAQVQD